MAGELVSVILPTYNRAEILPRSIHSVRGQTYPHWELVIVDDGSTDNTSGVVADAAEDDPRIVYRHTDNRGPAESRNLGMRTATGAYLAFLDSDDEYLPYHLELRVKYMNEHPEVEFLHGGVHILGGIEQKYVPDKDNPEVLVPLSDCVIGGTFFCRAGMIESAGGWKPGYAEDADLFERIREICAVREVGFETYIYHRDRPDSRVNNASGNS